jgi:hypothetical protein
MQQSVVLVLGSGEECLDDVVDKGQPLPALAHKIKLDVWVALMPQLDVAFSVIRTPEAAHR